MAKKHKRWGNVKAHKRRVAGIFGIAAKNKQYKAAKKKAEAAQKKASRLWAAALKKASKAKRITGTKRKRRYRLVKKYY